MHCKDLRGGSHFFPLRFVYSALPPPPNIPSVEKQSHAALLIKSSPLCVLVTILLWDVTFFSESPAPSRGPGTREYSRFSNNVDLFIVVLLTLTEKDKVLCSHSHCLNGFSLGSPVSSRTPKMCV